MKPVAATRPLRHRFNLRVFGVMGAALPSGLSAFDMNSYHIEPGPLEEEYSIGVRLGFGAFGVVSRCRRLGTNEELAVKKVDTRLHSAADALSEAEMMRTLHHPNIVKHHATFLEGSYVFIVMDAYLGGDLVDGLQYRLKHHPNMRPDSVTHIVRQIVSSVDYLHERRIVHRDVKGDNFLTDREDITHPECRIALADFGAACRLAPGHRLHKIIGTAKFSAPELYDRDYGVKVDMWAVGVVTYGLLTGRFPFRNETEVREKTVRMTSEIDEVCQDLVQGLLQKCEARRLSAREALRHTWLRQNDMFQGSPSFHKGMETESTTAYESSSDHSDPGCQGVEVTEHASGEAFRDRGCLGGLARCRALLPARWKSDFLLLEEPPL